MSRDQHNLWRAMEFLLEEIGFVYSFPEKTEEHLPQAKKFVLEQLHSHFLFYSLWEEPPSWALEEFSFPISHHATLELTGEDAQAIED